MKSNPSIHRILTLIIALIWFINGFFCKVLNFVPRHELIVKNILDTEYSRAFTIVIGISEILMAIWILSGVKSKLNAIFQIVIIASMNLLEFLLVPELLLWGKFNSLFALLLIISVYFNEFYFKKKQIQKQ